MERGIVGKVLGVAAAAGLAAAMVLSAPTDASAQESMGVDFGVEGSYGTEIEAVGVGGRLMLTIPGAQGFGAMGSFDWFFPDVGDYYEFNANGTYTFQTPGGVAPYVGAGLNVGTTSNGTSVTNSGVNFLGGLELGGGGPVTPFVEGRYATTGTGQFLITGGILF